MGGWGVSRYQGIYMYVPSTNTSESPFHVRPSTKAPISLMNELERGNGTFAAFSNRISSWPLFLLVVNDVRNSEFVRVETSASCQILRCCHRRSRLLSCFRAAGWQILGGEMRGEGGRREEKISAVHIPRFVFGFGGRESERGQGERENDGEEQNCGRIQSGWWRRKAQCRVGGIGIPVYVRLLREAHMPDFPFRMYIGALRFSVPGTNIPVLI